MLVKHVGKRPVIDDSVVIAPTAVISGDVYIGAGTVVLAVAVITAQGASLRIGESCIIMENTMIRGAVIPPNDNMQHGDDMIDQAPGSSGKSCRTSRRKLSDGHGSG